MSIKIKTVQSADAPTWDKYVHDHPRATLYHLSGWKNVINKTYGHKTYYLMAIKGTQQQTTNIQQKEDDNPINFHPASPVAHVDGTGVKSLPCLPN